MEKQICKSMAALGCRSEGVKKHVIGGRDAWGVRYSYTVQDTGMTGESYVLKDGREIWYLHVYMRTALLADSEPVWESILDSAAFA